MIKGFPGGPVVKTPCFHCRGTAGGVGLMPGQGTRIIYATQRGQEFKKKQQQEALIISLMSNL